MNRQNLLTAVDSMLSLAPLKTVVLVGDFCLDVYYHIDSRDLEPSLETGLMVRRVNTLKDSLGGAGNVFANLCALGTGKVIPIGVIGPDMFGAEMQRLMDAWLPSCQPLTVQAERWTTPAYMKPILDGKEQERIDTGLHNSITEDTVDILLGNLEKALATADVVMINQQLEGSIYTDRFIEGLNALAAKHQDVPFLVDSRTMQSRFRGMIHKLNTHEVASEAGIELDPMRSELPMDELQSIIKKYHEFHKDKVIVSRGEFGSVSYDGHDFIAADGISLLTELDTVGAGDSFFAGAALSLATGLNLEEAQNIGNAVSGVTVQKLHQTGTASPDELRTLVSACDYTYNADIRPYRCEVPFKMEVISDMERIRRRPAIKYAVFDHDGTISVLREGWEDVMEACMIDAITGGRSISAEQDQSIRRCCREFIRKSTGIQTICQMAMLVDIVKKWGMVPADKVLTAKQYKEIYNTALLKHIADRLDNVRKGLLTPEDATIAGSIGFLRTLAENGVTIYLASGTDEEDVKKEVSLLGYAECFTGGIYGSVGDLNNDPKRQVLKKILQEEGVDMERLVIFGDGPVEMREAHDNGALAFGVLSNEMRRYGWNESKHERLLHAGADLLVPDFMEYKKIAAFLLKK